MEAELPLNPNCPGCAAAAKRIADLEARLAALEALVGQLRRGGKRQAAPFSKGPPKPDPKPPGRKPGGDYGTPHARRPAPPRIDEHHHATLPDACPACGGHHLDPAGTARQYQAEIPRTVIYREFTVHVGRCRDCGTRVQGRHPLQTSDALGAAASQLGPDAQALAVHLNKDAGLSHGKVAAFLKTAFGLSVTRSACCQAVLRAGRRGAGTYDAIVAAVQASPAVVPDETGWRVGGTGAWLHVAATPAAVAYLVHATRGHEASALLLGPDYAGTLTRDGWSAYRRFWRATHQACLTHLLRRCKELLEGATRGAVVFPRKVKAILKEALSVRDDRDAGRLSDTQAAARADELDERMGRLLRPVKANRANETFARHLWENRRHLFTFLRDAGVDAANWRAEQAIRPAVVNRKVWGGNRTWAGAEAQSVLTSILQTAKLLGRDAIDFLSRLLCAPAGHEPLLITA